MRIEEDKKEKIAEIEIKIEPTKKVFRELDELYKQIEKEKKTYPEGRKKDE
jgi:hypothetical protein